MINKTKNKGTYFYINKCLIKKEFDDKKLKSFIFQISSLLEEEPNNLKYKRLLANLYIENNDYYAAQKIYLNMIKDNETNPSAYYGLFKIDLLINDDANLLYDLGDYEYFSNSNNINLDLLYDLTNLYLDLKEGKENNYDFNYNGIIVTQLIKNKQLDEYLKNAFDNIKTKNYGLALNFLELAQKYNEKNMCAISIYPMYLLVSKICNLTNTKDYKVEKKKSLENGNFDLFAKICEFQIKIGKYMTNDLFNDCQRLLHLRKLDEAKLLLDKLSSRIVSKEEKIAYAYLKNTYEELFSLVDEETKCLKISKDSYLNNDYYDSIESLKRGYEINHNNLFIYYISKCYKLASKKNFNIYIEYLKKYSEKAGKKAIKAYVQLTNYYLLSNNKKEAKKYFVKYKSLQKTFDVYRDNKNFDYEWLENLMYNGKYVIKNEKQISKTLKLKDFKSE